MSKGILFTVFAFISTFLFLTFYFLETWHFFRDLPEEMIPVLQITFIVLQFSTFLLNAIAIHFLCKEKGIKVKDQAVATAASITCCGPVVPLMLIFQAPGKNGSSF